MKTNHFIYIFIFSYIVLSFIPKKISAEDSIAVEKHIYLAYDFAKPARYILNNNYNQQEITFGIYTGSKYNFAGDFGFGNVYLTRNNYKIDISGFYFKTGYEKSIYNDNRDFFSYGFKLAAAHFKNTYKNAYLDNGVFANLPLDPESSKLFSMWGEALLRLNILIIGNFGFGWSVRVKFPIYFQKDTYQKPYFVPGYGTTYNSAMLGFHYYLSYKIPFN